MNDNQQKFADMVQQNKSTIYTVCYMFSKDQDEVNDFFKRCSSACGKDLPTLRAEAM